MERDINLVIEEVKTQVINTINQSGLPISVVYYIMKDVMNGLDTTYSDYIKQAYNQEMEQQMNKPAPAEEMTEIEPPIIED